MTGPRNRETLPTFAWAKGVEYVRADLLDEARAERVRAVEALRNIDAIHQRVAAIIRLNAPAKAAWARDAIRLLAAVPVEEEDKTP